MGKNAIIKAFRPRNIGATGMVVSIDMKNVEWLGQLVSKYYKKSMSRKILKKISCIEAIKLFEDGKQTELVIINKKADSQLFRVDHYSGDNNEADVSLQLSTKEGYADFKRLTPNSDLDFCRQIANFIVCVCTYEFLMRTDKSIKTDEIIPFEIFGEAIV